MNNNIKKKSTQQAKKSASKIQKTQSKKPKKKLTRAQYDELRQIEWFPVDPYAD